jgi:inosose dehydratase
MANLLRVANAPCSWGVLEFDLQGDPIRYPQMLDELAATGYRGTELGDYGFMPTEPARLRDELERRDLALLGAFVPVALADEHAHAAGIDDALKIARLLRAASDEAPFVVLADANGTVPRRTQNAGRIGPQDELDAATWRVFAAGAELVAREVREQTGLRTVFHHHGAGYVETPAEIDRFLELTDPALIGLCFDTGHYTFGGGDALEGMRRHRDRIWHVHFKDCHPDVAIESREEGWDYFTAVRRGIFCELGLGSVDFPAIVELLRSWQYDGWIVVEQDVLPGLGTPRESAARNRAYLQSLGL